MSQGPCYHCILNPQFDTRFWKSCRCSALSVRVLTVPFHNSCQRYRLSAAAQYTSVLHLRPGILRCGPCLILVWLSLGPLGRVDCRRVTLVRRTQYQRIGQLAIVVRHWRFFQGLVQTEQACKCDSACPLVVNTPSSVLSGSPSS
jgi:hypothetical protein